MDVGSSFPDGTSGPWLRRAAPAFTLAVAVLAAPAAASEDGIPRTPAGRPDFSGTYDAATLTPLERPPEFGDKLYLTPEEAREIAEQEAAYIAARSGVSDPDREAPPEGGDGSTGASGNVGGYNAFWIDRGTEPFLVDGKFRTSIVIDPADGQIPEMTAEGRAELARRFASYRRSNDGTAWWIDEGDEPGPYDNPEQRGNAERCLLGFSGGAPPLPSLYNNFKRIVQTDDHVMILIEMVHDARVVRMDSEHLPADQRSWLGDSIGWWEGDTLVIDTTNYRAESRQARGGTENLHLVERLTMMEDGNILYNFTVDDPTVWQRPWTGEYVWRRSDDRLYEYACHEGNYALEGILRGARVLEQEAIEAKQKGESRR